MLGGGSGAGVGGSTSLIQEINSSTLPRPAGNEFKTYLAIETGHVGIKQKILSLL